MMMREFSCIRDSIESSVAISRTEREGRVSPGIRLSILSETSAIASRRDGEGKRDGTMEAFIIGLGQALRGHIDSKLISKKKERGGERGRASYALAVSSPSRSH